MRRLLVTLATALLPLLGHASVASLPNSGVNLVQNGGFEDYPQNSGSWSIYSSGRNWSTASNGIEIRDNVSGRAAEGSNYAELDTTKNSNIFQDIATEIGGTYQLSFKYSNRSGTAVATNGLDWWFGDEGGAVPVIAVNNSGDNRWSSFTVQLTATSTLSRLGFRATGTSDSYGSSLDDISVLYLAAPKQANALTGGDGVILTPVPEPEQGLLMLIGLAAVVAARRRRKN